MADWRIVTPTRAPRDDEIAGVGYIVLSPGNISIMYSSYDEMLSIMFQNVQPVVRYYYDFLKNEWKDESFSPIDITMVDMTVPESAISSATTKTSYFDLIAFEKGTTACKLAVANEAKTLIRSALIAKGVDVPDTTPFRQYAGKVGEISAAGGIAAGELRSSTRYQARGFSYFDAEEGVFKNVTLGGSSSNPTSATIKVRKGSTIIISSGYSEPAFSGDLVYAMQTNTNEWQCLADGDFTIQIKS